MKFRQPSAHSLKNEGSHFLAVMHWKAPLYYYSQKFKEYLPSQARVFPVTFSISKNEYLQ